MRAVLIDPENEPSPRSSSKTAAIGKSTAYFAAAAMRSALGSAAQLKRALTLSMSAMMTLRIGMILGSGFRSMPIATHHRHFRLQASAWHLAPTQKAPHAT
jgi:hypothetical protein